MHPLNRAFWEDWMPRLTYMCAHRCLVHRFSPPAPLLPFFPESGCSFQPHDAASASASQLCWLRQPSTLSFPFFTGHPKLEHLLSLALVFCFVLFFIVWQLHTCVYCILIKTTPFFPTVPLISHPPCSLPTSCPSSLSAFSPPTESHLGLPVCAWVEEHLLEHAEGSLLGAASQKKWFLPLLTVVSGQELFS